MKINKVKGRKKFLKNIHANLCLLILHKNNIQVEISILSRENSCKNLSEILSCEEGQRVQQPRCDKNQL